MRGSLNPAGSFKAWVAGSSPAALTTIPLYSRTFRVESLIDEAELQIGERKQKTTPRNILTRATTVI